MKKLVTNMDQHGRVLIPSEIREKLNIQPGDKVNLEVYENEVKIISVHNYKKYLPAKEYAEIGQTLAFLQ